MFGCFNRPWNKLDLADALAAIRDAGYQGIGFMRQQGEFLIGPDSSPSDLVSLAERVADHGLQPVIALSGCSLDVGEEAYVEHYRRTIDKALLVGVAQVMSTGGPREFVDTFCKAAQRIARHASDVGATFVLKTHGKLSSTGEDCARILDRVGDEGFGIWYDAGNVLYYDNVRPEEDVKSIAGRVIGLCVKDCIGGESRDVNLTPGDGDAALAQVYGTLVDAGFQGPALVECLAGDTPKALAAEARRAREFLERTLGKSD